MDIEQAAKAIDRPRRTNLLGAGLIVFGAAGILLPLAAGVVMVVVIGAFLILSGVIHLLHAMESRPWDGHFLGFLTAMLSLICGLLMILHPLLGLNFLAMMLSVYFMGQGIIAVVRSLSKTMLQRRRFLLHGLGEIILGGLIYFQWPIAGEWAVGVCVGAHLLVRGGLLLSSKPSGGESAAKPIAVE